jgi:hypothetical protein
MLVNEWLLEGTILAFLKNEGWNILVSAEHVKENANIDFLNSSLMGIDSGLMWRSKGINGSVCTVKKLGY